MFTIMQKGQARRVGTLAAVTAAAAAAAVGAYWLYGAKSASKNRKMAKSWMLKARADVMDAVEKVGDIDKETYLHIVDDVVKGYTAMADAKSKEITQLVKDLKGSWRYMQMQKRPAINRVKSVKKSVRRVAEKAAKRRG